MSTFAALRLFGWPAAADGTPLAAERLGQMAVVLAARGEWTPREQLIALLWPELPDESARRNLRKLLFRARRQPWLAALETRADALRWRVESDLRDFEAACTRQDWAQAVVVYASAFCDGFEQKASAPFVEWLRFEQHRLGALFRQAAARRLAQISHDGPACEAVARHWLALDPLDEDAVVALAAALRVQGRDAEAQRLVADFTQRLQQEVGVAPSGRIRGLSEARAAAPAARAAATADFVGRRAELLELLALQARAECRVLTIVGPGGIGKSRLARVAFDKLHSNFESAAWIGLEDLTLAAQVVSRIAAALGLAPARAGDPLAKICGALREKRVLLVFDNAEHLDGTAQLADQLVQSCPQAKLLVTSRARLAVAGEWLLPLTGLPVPDADETEDEVLRTFDAVKLFELRARAAAPSFAGAAAPGEVAALVRMLEGAPLAIELAAAWVRVLPVAEIRREIEHSLDLLHGAAHVPERQRSIRASFEHSWRLLAPVEQRSLASLSVFATPFTREAAAQVAEAGLPVLAALADKSLLRAHGDGRFSFHALMQENARAKLADPAPVRRRHRDYFTRLLASLPPGRISQSNTLAEIDAVLEDCRAAWQHAIATRATAALEAMAPVLGRFFEAALRQDEGIALFEPAVHAIGPAPADTCAVLQHMVGMLYLRNGDLARADAALRTALPFFRAAGHRAAVSQCARRLGTIEFMDGAFAAAQPHFEEALQAARAAGEDAEYARSLNALAACVGAMGDFDRAIALQEQALRLYESGEASADPIGQAVVLNDLGTLLLGLRRHAEAKRALARGLALSEAHQVAFVRDHCFFNLAMTEIELGELETAQTRLLQALRTERTAGAHPLSTLFRLGLTRIAARRGEAKTAASFMHEALVLARTRASISTQLLALSFVAELLALRGERERAATLWTFLAEHPQNEALDRANARAELEQLQLAPAAALSAQRAARGLELDAMLEALIGELRP